MNDHIEGFGIAVVYLTLGSSLWVIGRVERRRYLFYWMAALLLFGGHSLVNSVVRGFGLPDPFNAVAWVLLVAGCGAVAAGARSFIGRPTPWWWIALGLGLLVGGALSLWLGVSPDLLRFPVFAFIGAALAGGGLMVLRHGPRGGGRQVSGSACVAAGLWACVYPAIHRFPIVKPMEFFVDLSFVVAATTGVVLMHFEAARQRAEALASRYRSLFDSAQVGLFRVDRSGRVLAANPAMLALWNTSEEQALTLDLFRDVYVEPTIAQEVGERLLRGASVDAHEARWRRRDDDDVLVSVAARPVLGPDGVPLHYEGSAYDVGRERALRQQLEHSDRLDALGRLASGIAHDFNNALTVIINGTELARSHLQRDPRRANDLLDTTLEAARGATQLTRQLLTFSRRRTPEREAIDVHAVLRSLSRMLDATLGERVRVTLELAAEPVTAWAQPGQLEQILTNLALNSRDAMPEGGTLGFATRSVQLPDGREGTRIEVTDDGSGMSEATRRHLFEPFFTTKASELGTGLGLATVYGIVQQLEGRIEVTSEVGRGSTFAVELPAAATPERAAAPAATSLLPQARATVLVVEDRDLLRRSTELALRDAGHRVIVAASGHEALAIAQTQPFDVLLTDIVMPGMSGPILAEQLRLRWPQLPVVFMSGHLESAAEAPHLPGSRFLAKPFTVGELTATVAGAAHSAA